MCVVAGVWRGYGGLPYGKPSVFRRALLFFRRDFDEFPAAWAGQGCFRRFGFLDERLPFLQGRVGDQFGWECVERLRDFREPVERDVPVEQMVQVLPCDAEFFGEVSLGESLRLEDEDGVFLDWYLRHVVKFSAKVKFRIYIFK